jgi:hypothetical protein
VVGVALVAAAALTEAMVVAAAVAVMVGEFNGGGGIV